MLKLVKKKVGICVPTRIKRDGNELQDALQMTRKKADSVGRGRGQP
jgi:hypothetical protein